jgi:hypothetical protein
VDRLRGDRRELVSEIGLEKGAVTHAGLFEAFDAAEEPRLIADAANHYKRVFTRKRKKCAGSFKRGMTGLHHLLRVAQVSADENVDIRIFCNLPELHDGPPLRRENRKHALRPPGFEPGHSDFRDRLLCR